MANNAIAMIIRTAGALRVTAAERVEGVADIESGTSCGFGRDGRCAHRPPDAPRRHHQSRARRRPPERTDPRRSPAASAFVGGRGGTGVPSPRDGRGNEGGSRGEPNVMQWQHRLLRRSSVDRLGPGHPRRDVDEHRSPTPCRGARVRRRRSWRRRPSGPAARRAAGRPPSTGLHRHGVHVEPGRRRWWPGSGDRLTPRRPGLYGAPLRIDASAEAHSRSRRRGPPWASGGPACVVSPSTMPTPWTPWP